MANLHVPGDFREFLKLLGSHKIEYLLVGGYAVSLHGYVRTTGDLDIWVRVGPENAARLKAALVEFGFSGPDVREELFLDPDSIIRMGVPPVRIEILTRISGLDFDEAYSRRQVRTMENVTFNLISLEDLKTNKRAAGRHKDLDDIDNLP